MENRHHTRFRKAAVGAVAALLGAAIATGAQGFVPGGGSSVLGGSGRRMVSIKGNVVCANCSLEEARKAQPTEHDLYELIHRRGQVVIKISSVNGSGMWDFPQPPRLLVRARDGVFQQLIAEENLKKGIKIIGLLNNLPTLDLYSVTVVSPS